MIPGNIVGDVFSTISFWFSAFSETAVVAIRTVRRSKWFLD
jgi:hypothetical protein